MRPQFKNVPTAVSIVPDNPEEPWLSDGRLVNITGPALVISDEHSARTQINLENVTCKEVPVLASFRESGKTDGGGGFNEQHFVWDDFQRLTQITDGKGVITELQWDNSSPIKFRNLTRRIEAKLACNNG